MDPREKIDFIANLEQHEQRSEGWFKQRMGKLTSSDAATALGINPYQVPEELLFKKCGAGAPFTGNVATLHGQKYEDVAIEKYCQIMGKTNYDFGLIELNSINPIRKKTPLDDFIKKYPDIDISFLAGSPDGIAVDNENMEDLILLEVKCPYRRNIVNGYCPAYYFPQVQLNMHILDIDKSDFIEFTPARVAPKFLREPELNIVRIHRDYDWFEENVPILYRFWQEVLKWRARDIVEHPLYDKYAYKEKPKPESKFVEDSDEHPSLISKISVSMFRSYDQHFSFNGSFQNTSFKGSALDYAEIF